MPLEDRLEELARRFAVDLFTKLADFSLGQLADLYDQQPRRRRRRSRPRRALPRPKVASASSAAPPVEDATPVHGLAPEHTESDMLGLVPPAPALPAAEEA